MPRSKLPPAELAWWRSNFKESINRVAPHVRRAIRKILGEGKLELAQNVLWEALLYKNGLTMNEGIKNVVYVEAEGLDMLRTGVAKIETRYGHWATPRIKGTMTSSG